MTKTEVKSNLDGLEQLTKMLKDDKFVRIGILGSKAHAQHDSESGLTNAVLGTYHEFGGTSKNGNEQPPQRSFLGMPLTEQLQFSEPQMREMKKVLWKQFFVKKSPDAFWQKLLKEAINIVDEAFNTGGFGQWKPLATSTKNKIAKKHKVMTEEELRNYQLSKREISTGKLNKRFLKSDAFWFGSLEEVNGDLTVTSGRTPLTETGALRHSITGKIMKRK